MSTYHSTTPSPNPSQIFPTAATEIQRFFDLLYPGIGEGYLLLSWPSPTRTHKDGKPALDTSWHNLATTALGRIADRAAAIASTHSVYFGVAIQHPSRHPNPFQRSRNDSAALMPALYFDIDLASGAHAASALPATDADALAFLQTLPAKPSLILHTGGGLHGYWLFESPIYLTTDPERAAMAHLLKEFAYTLRLLGTAYGWELDALRDLARVLRPAGTINHKYGKPVAIIAESAARYTPADFDWLTTLPAPSVHHGPGAGVHDQPDLLRVVEAYGGTLTQKSASEWHGAHPIHGSSTGVNLDVNGDKGLWHCWRHGTGGDALSMIALGERLIGCEDLQPGALSGTRFAHVLEIAHNLFDWTPPGAPRSYFPALTPHLSRGLSTVLRRTL